MKTAKQADQKQRAISPAKRSLPRKAKAVQKKPFKGRHVHTVEEIAQRNCPFPDESEWVAELEKFHGAKGN